MGIEILVHLYHALAAAHVFEAGIVATNVWLVRATYSAIPEADRPHRKVAILAFRAHRAIMLRVRHQHRLRMLDATLVGLREAARREAAILAHHRAKFAEFSPEG